MNVNRWWWLYLTFVREVFAAVLELDQFLKEEEEERREKEEKVSCSILQRGEHNMCVCWTLCTWEIEDYEDRECPLTYSKYLTSHKCEGGQTAELCPRLHWLCCKFEITLTKIIAVCCPHSVWDGNSLHLQCTGCCHCAPRWGEERRRLKDWGWTKERRRRKSWILKRCVVFPIKISLRYYDFH